MIPLVVSPKWFFNIDAVFESIIMLITLLIAIKAFKVFKFTKEKKYKLFGISFLSISLSFIFNGIMHLWIYSLISKKQVAGFVIFSSQTIYHIEFLFILGIILHRLFFLLGIFGLLNIVYKSKDRHLMYLSLMLLSMTAFFLNNQSFFLFHITTAVILGMISAYYLKFCASPRQLCMRLNAVSYSMLMISQILFIFSDWISLTYVIAQIVLLAGFLILLMEYLRMNKK